MRPLQGAGQTPARARVGGCPGFVVGRVSSNLRGRKLRALERCSTEPMRYGPILCSRPWNEASGLAVSSAWGMEKGYEAAIFTSTQWPRKFSRSSLTKEKIFNLVEIATDQLGLADSVIQVLKVGFGLPRCGDSNHS